MRRSILEDEGRTPLARPKAYFEALAEVQRKNELKKGCLLGNLSLEMAARSEVLRMHLRSAFDRWEASLREILAEARVRGDLAPGIAPEDAAAFILSAWEGLSFA